MGVQPVCPWALRICHAQFNLKNNLIAYYPQCSVVPWLNRMTFCSFPCMVLPAWKDFLNQHAVHPAIKRDWTTTGLFYKVLPGPSSNTPRADPSQMQIGWNSSNIMMLGHHFCCPVYIHFCKMGKTGYTFHEVAMGIWSSAWHINQAWSCCCQQTRLAVTFVISPYFSLRGWHMALKPNDTQEKKRGFGKWVQERWEPATRAITEQDGMLLATPLPARAS